LRHGRRPPLGVTSWTVKYLEWVKRDVHFAVKAQEATLLDYLHKVEHMAARITRLDGAIEEAVKLAPPPMRAVIEALQAMRGIAQVSAVTIVAELGEVTRFTQARQLMGYGGIVAKLAKTRVENASAEGALPRRVMRTCGGWWRGRLGVPTPARRGIHAAQTARESQRKGERDRLESPTPIA